MRLSFANGEHADFLLEGGAASLGNASGNTLVLAGPDIAAQHARLTEDRRGVVLEVLDPAARTHVNARPVREKALLRCGDVLCLGKVTITLKADRDDLIETSIPPESVPPATAQSPSRVILRGVSGSHFGRTIAVNHRIVVGSGADCGLVMEEGQIVSRHASIENVDESIYLRNIGGARNGSMVNGVRVTDAIVYPGDQVAFERNYFIVEAPGLPARGQARADDAQPLDVVDDRQASGVAAPPRARGAIWWLIGVAALIALALGLLIHRGI
ncbi:MAG: FHA domain-containing protein [Dokdonella sp.]